MLDRLQGALSPTSDVSWKNRANLQPLASLAKNRGLLCLFFFLFIVSEADCTLQ